MKHLLTYQDEKSDKFWEVEVKGKEMRVRYGKTGSEGQASVKKFTSVSAAETAAEKAIAEKVKKGYRNHETTGGGLEQKILKHQSLRAFHLSRLLICLTTRSRTRSF